MDTRLTTPEQVAQLSKACSKCGEIKPLTEFGSCASHRDGRASQCKACFKAYREAHREERIAKCKAWRAAHPDHTANYNKRYHAEHTEELRQARKRKYAENRDAMLADMKTRYVQNREARRAYTRRYYEAHKQECQEKSRARYHARKEEFAVRRKEYYWSHKEESAAYAHNYRITHPDELRSSYRAWRKANPLKERARQHRRRSRLAGNGGRHTEEDVREKFEAQAGLCYWCGKSIQDEYQVDHVIPISRGGTNDADNIVLACGYCNRSKKDKMPWEWKRNPRHGHTFNES